MGLFDRLRKKHQDVGKDKKPANAKEAVAATPAKEAEAPKTEKAEKATKKPRVLKANTRHAHRTLLRPILTEKSTRLTSLNQYVFAVPTTAGKVEVRDAVFAAYGVRPVHVTTRTVKGKAIRFGLVKGTQKSWKKATVTLPTGKTIDVTS